MCSFRVFFIIENLDTLAVSKNMHECKYVPRVVNINLDESTLVTLITTEPISRYRAIPFTTIPRSTISALCQYVPNYQIWYITNFFSMTTLTQHSLCINKYFICRLEFKSF